MAIVSDLASVAFGLSSAATWGVGDFSGGLATRRTPVRTVVIISQIAGLGALILLALLRAEAAPLPADIFWGAAAGIVGQIGLVALYRAMAIGQMGIAAPVTAVLSATLPALFGIITQGAPGVPHVAGFALALVGVWLLSRPEGALGRPAGFGLALIGGCGFGGFLILIAQVHADAIFWPLAVARVASLVVLIGFALRTRRFDRPTREALPLIALAGLMDAGGNAFFVFAEQAGRLDVAGVLASLYPATTVLLAVMILKEKLTRTRLFGVLLVLVAVPMIAAK